MPKLSGVMRLGFLKETAPGERRVALTPAALSPLTKRGVEVVFEAGAGVRAGCPDGEYVGARALPSAAEVLAAVDVLLQVRGPTPDLLPLLRGNQWVIGMLDPLGAPAQVAKLAERGVTAMALELLPRVTRAQSMDVLSSMANLVGYKGALLAAAECTNVFPMMMTAAGTIPAARVLVLGAGVAGLQAIATAKRLGAVVEAYDVRSEVAEQVRSVGGKFLELGLQAEPTGSSGTPGTGYASAATPEFLAAQRAALGANLKRFDAVITTALVPGKRAPILVTRAMAEQMKPGAALIDLASEQGGNCELTEPGRTIEHNGVRFLGPTQLVSTLAAPASQLISKNFVSFVLNLLGPDGSPILKDDDPILRDTLVAHGGTLVNERVRQALATAEGSARERAS